MDKKEYSKKYYNDNKEYIKQYNKLKYYEKRDEIAEKNKQKRDKIKENNRKYYEENKNKLKEKRAGIEQNEGIEQKNENSTYRTMKKRNNMISKVRKQIKDDKYICWYADIQGDLRKSLSLKYLLN
jgi:hypothetical protein